MKSEVIRECVTLSARSGKASWRWSLMGYNLRDRWEKLGRRESRWKKQLQNTQNRVIAWDM